MDLTQTPDHRAGERTAVTVYRLPLAFAATLHNVANPSGVPVRFDIAGANRKSTLARTNGSGQATISHAGVFAGTDIVTAIAAPSGKTIESAPGSMARR